ncbi:MAG: hypothetical protein AAF501_15440, partial [Pseudomonadota bacterium]
SAVLLADVLLAAGRVFGTLDHLRAVAAGYDRSRRRARSHFPATGPVTDLSTPPGETSPATVHLAAVHLAAMHLAAIRPWTPQPVSGAGMPRPPGCPGRYRSCPTRRRAASGRSAARRR